jgi:hypothetical protein
MNPQDFERKLNEVLGLIWDIKIFDYAVVFIMCLLISVLVLFVLGISIYYSFIPSAVIVAGIYIVKGRNEDHIQIMEGGNPALKERLETAYDNRKREDNFIVRELMREVTADLNNIHSDAFLDIKRVNSYVAVSVIVVFILLSLLFLGFEGVGLPGLFGSFGGGDGGNSGTGSGSGGGGGGAEDAGDVETAQDKSIGKGPPQDIYADRSIAKIEGQELEMEIHPEYGEQEGVDQTASSRGKAEDIAEGFVQATAAESYDEDIPVELESVVRKYFEKLAEK